MKTYDSHRATATPQHTPATSLRDAADVCLAVAAAPAIILYTNC